MLERPIKYSFGGAVGLSQPYYEILGLTTASNTDNTNSKKNLIKREARDTLTVDGPNFAFKCV